MPNTSIPIVSAHPGLAALREQLQGLLPGGAPAAADSQPQGASPILHLVMEYAPLLMNAAGMLLRRRGTQDVAQVQEAPRPARRRGYVRPLLLIGLGACVAYAVGRAMAPGSGSRSTTAG